MQPFLSGTTVFFEHEFRTQSIRTPDRLLIFPIVVCSSFEHVYRIDILSGSHSDPSNVGDRFQFEALYAYMQDGVPQNEYFLIDFVAFESLEDFEKEIEQDVRAAQTLLH